MILDNLSERENSNISSSDDEDEVDGKFTEKLNKLDTVADLISKFENSMDEFAKEAELLAKKLNTIDEGEIRKPPEIVPVPICSRHKNQSVFTIPKMDELLEDSPAKRLADVRK